MSGGYQERGGVLLIALLVLAALGLLGLVSASDAQLQQKLSGHAIEAEQALAEADRTLATGERWLQELPSDPRIQPCAPNCTLPLYATNEMPLEAAQGDPAWWAHHGQPTADHPGRFAVEELIIKPETDDATSSVRALYRVLAWYAPPGDVRPVLIESLWIRHWGDLATDCPEDERELVCGRVAWRRHQ